MSMITMNTITLALIALSVVIGIGALLVEAVYDWYHTPRMKRARRHSTRQEKRAMKKYVVTHRETGRFLVTQATTPAAAQMRASALFGWVPSQTSVKGA